MPTPGPGRAASAAGQCSSTRKPASSSSSEHHCENPRGAQAMLQLPRRESAGQHAAPSAASSAAQRPGGLKHRAYSAPLVPKHRADGSADDIPADLQCEPGDEITGDEFFQRYHFPQPNLPATHDLSSSSADSSSDTEGPLSPTHSKNRQPAAADNLSSPAPSVASANSDPSAAMQDLTIAVLGARGTGKSVFIRRALNLPDSVELPIATRNMTIDGGYYIVRFLEICFTDVHIGDRNSIKWPETIGDLATPRIDGVVAIYDVTREDSLAPVPETLDVLSISSVPFILVASKCDQHPAHRAVDPAIINEKAKSYLGDVNTFQTSQDRPETQRQCLSVITRAVIASKRPRSQASMARRRANSSAVRSITAKDPWARKHERASSEFSTSRYRPRSSEYKGHRYKSSEAGKTFLDLEESPGYDSYDSGDEASDTEQSVVSPSDENGYTFDQLVDRLLAQTMSKNDSKFIAIFLSLYRRFATPSQLLDAILKRFEHVKREKTPPMMKMISQLRYLEVLQQWVSRYPGDFAYPTTRKTIRKFATSISANREFAVAAREIIHDLDFINEDDDTDWACSDRQRLSNDQLPGFLHNVLDEDSEDDDFAKALGHMSMSSDRLSIARSSVTQGSRTTEGSAFSTHTLLNQVEKNEKLAKELIPNPIKALSKSQWHQLMGESEESIARELTRIDWIMFSSIRPRDLVRHVSLSADEKKRCRSLENVTRMTEHFNHVAYLVTNYILLRDKPKHRALMLEKWMKIARELRKLNNYNSLGAVLAGVRGTAVHRLVATRELVPQNTSKDFMKLEILMGTQKSHFAYRLAWENSTSERIPYIPLHRRDLVSASEGNSTFVKTPNKASSSTGSRDSGEIGMMHPGVSVFQNTPGNRDSREAPPQGVSGKERINWRKFEIMGEVIVGVQKAQGTPYPSWPKCEEVRNLILDTKISKDDDELYERSTQLESAGAGEKPRFKFWTQGR